ncbi:hypothetical protein WBP07_31635 [Novosphingobium sp. BL-8A]|uniref:hypothetical protein n=1 Tax=Novosphingobium sp. BL-8A TaxID=3127639 RepID=UPI0037568322
MRIDARNLLDRLGRSDFAYKEFEDRFTDLELWPIMEALLRDPRLQALDPALRQKAQAVNTPSAERSAPDPTGEPSAEPLKALFSRYEQDVSPAVEPEVSPASPPSPNVRGLLRRLSGQDGTGTEGQGED